MAVRMKDIANDLGLSVVTVSKVLRDHPDIAEETKARVLKRVQELDYQPNILARSLVTGRSYLIGLIVPSLLHPFFAEIAMALSAVVKPLGYSVIISSSEEDPDQEAREIRQLVARRIDALVIASTAAGPASFEHLDRVKQPYVLIDREIENHPANFVGIDDVAAGRMATEHLIEQGCRRIAHLCGCANTASTRRREGYMEALREAGLPVEASLVVRRDNVDIESMHQGAEAARQLLRQPNRPDGIFCFNDPLAIGAMNAILDAGLRIPEDIALVGCGNQYYNVSLRVPLSSVDQRSAALGECAAKIILAGFAARSPLPPSIVVMEPGLMVRASSLRRDLEL